MQECDYVFAAMVYRNKKAGQMGMDKGVRWGWPRVLRKMFRMVLGVDPHTQDHPKHFS